MTKKQHRRCRKPFSKWAAKYINDFLHLQEWKAFLYDDIVRARKEEWRLAVEGDVICEDGTPYITVVFDKEWSHRSHGH